MPDLSADGSVAPETVLTNGHNYGNGHKSAERTDDTPFLPEEHLSLPDLCSHIHMKVKTFLDTTPKDDQMKRVQEQTRISLNVIAEALKRYESVWSF